MRIYIRILTMPMRCWGTFDKNAIIWEPTNRPFPSSLGPLYQNGFLELGSGLFVAEITDPKYRK